MFNYTFDMTIKYKNEIIINAPREKVVKLFTDPSKIEKWQPGFISMKRISGNEGEVGSKNLMQYKIGRREMELTETITKVNLPHEFTGTYETKGVFNKVENFFEEISENQTKYWTTNEFQLHGFMKIIGFLFPGTFKKQSQKYLVLFKDFVESE